jgi:cytochrome c553
MIFRAALLATLILPLSALAADIGDIEAGKAKSVICQACHGADGNGIGDPQYPLLAGQFQDYLAKSLRDYKSGARDNAIMKGFASTLSDQDMLDLAAYFASQPTKLRDLQGIH